MIVSTHTGKVIHHNNCTYCVVKLDRNTGTKSKKRVSERCLLHNRKVAPLNTSQRYCEDYIQERCECDVCSEKYKRFDIETLLDKKDMLW